MSVRQAPRTVTCFTAVLTSVVTRDPALNQPDRTRSQARCVLRLNLLSATSLYDVTITIIVTFNSTVNYRERHLHINFKRDWARRDRGTRDRALCRRASEIFSPSVNLCSTISVCRSCRLSRITIDGASENHSYIHAYGSHSFIYMYHSCIHWQVWMLMNVTIHAFIHIRKWYRLGKSGRDCGDLCWTLEEICPLISTLYITFCNLSFSKHSFSLLGIFEPVASCQDIHIS